MRGPTATSRSGTRTSAATSRRAKSLADIDTPEIDQQLAQARADLVTSQANLSLVDSDGHALPGPDQDRFRFTPGPRQCQRRPRRQASHGAIGRCQRQAPGRDGIVQACVRTLYGGHHAAQCRSRHAHQCRKWRDGHQGNVRSGADRSDARLCCRARSPMSPSIHLGLKACLVADRTRADGVSADRSCARQTPLIPTLERC